METFQTSYLFTWQNMVKITEEYLMKNCDRLKIQPPRKRNESEEDFLKRITHLKLQGRFVEQLEKLKSCSNVTFLYLQNNILQSIHNMEGFTQLTNLYLQRNKIVKLENLDCLVNLKKLYLGYNEIAVIEGLENLKLLRELHVEYQNLPLGETVYFDPRSVHSLSTSLHVLNISGNGIVSLSPLQGMQELCEIYTAENKLSDKEELANALKTWPKLMKITLAGNPVQTERYFKDTAILASPSLKFLDETEVTPTTRMFLQGWKKARSSTKKTNFSTNQVQSEAQAPVTKAVHFSQFTKARNELPPRTNILPKPLAFQPWKLRRSVNNFDGKLSPRPSGIRLQQPLDETSC